MAIEALCAEEFCALVRSRSEVRIMAAGAGHFVAAHALAGAFAKLLYFAHATSRQIVAGVYIEGEVVRDRFARAIVEGRAACSLDGNITLKMTADAN